jgi:hypothetical protein
VSSLDRLDDEYETAEAAYLAGLRECAERPVLGALAAGVAGAALAYNAQAYKELHAAAGERREVLDLLTERTEVLSDLWADIADAYGRDAAPARAERGRHG